VSYGHRSGAGTGRRGRGWGTRASQRRGVGISARTFYIKDTFPMEFDVATLIIGIVIGLLASIAGTILAPSVVNWVPNWYADIQNWYAGMSIKRAERRIALLESRLEEYRKFLNSPSIFIAHIAERAITYLFLIFVLAFLLLAIDFSIYFNKEEELTKDWITNIFFINVVPIFIAVLNFHSFIQGKLRVVNEFEKNEKNIQSQIEKLQNTLAKKRQSAS
jgi:hypothetical protein